MRKLALLLLLVCYCIASQAQGEATHGHFGYNSGFNFTKPYTTNNVVINSATGQTITKFINLLQIP